MDASEPLRSLMADLGQAFNGGDRVDIVFPGEEVRRETEDGTVEPGPSPASMATTADGEVILNPDVNGHYDVDLDGPNQLRLLIDALHHEIEHVRQTDLDRISDVADEHGRHAATMFNIVEDQYINRTRTNRHKGRRKDLAYKARVAIMGNSEPVDELDAPNRLTSALNQLCWGGYIKGFAGLPEEERRFLAWARQRLEAARQEDTQDARVEAAIEIADRLEDLQPDPPEWDLPPAVEGLVADEGEAGEGSPADADAEGAEGEEEGAGGEGEEEGDDGEEEADGGGEPGEGDGDGEPGDGDGDADGGAPSDVDPEDLEDAMEDLEAADDEETPALDAPANWAGPMAYDTPDSAANYWERVQREEARRDTDLAYYERKRDLIIEDDEYDDGARYGSTPLDRWDEYHARHPYSYSADEADTRDHREHGHEDVRKAYDDELSEDIEDAFRQFKSRPREKPAKQGPRLNRHNVVRHLAGERGLPLHQRRTERQELGDRVVGVTVDTSGSMGHKELNAKKAIAAIASATETIGDDFLATTFSTTYDDSHDLGLMTGPDEPFEMRHLDAMVPGGAECPAPAALWTADLMDRVGARERVLIVIHDGKPHIGLEEGKSRTGPAVEDMTKTVNTLREDGYTVIGMGVGDGVKDETMAKMFGEDGWVMADVEDMADELTDIYQDQMDVSLTGRR